MIPENHKNIKSFLSENKNDIFLAGSFFLIAVISFGLGRLSFMMENRTEKMPVRVEENGAVLGLAGKQGVEGQGNEALLYLGSKNGTVYHLPSCSGAKRIAEENKIWFSSKEEAEGLGYRPAKNCDGL